MKSRYLVLPLITPIVALFVPFAIASAADVPTVPLSTAEAYSVLAGSTVTNTGPSVLNDSLGLSPGSSVTGFPPGTITAPGVKNIANPAAVTAKANLTTAYLNAKGRSISATVKADLAGLTLGPGVYAANGKGPLSLSGSLTLNANGNDNAVFIFQTDSTLITASSSTMILTNGANACRVFWQVGSSATLGTSSRFKGSILALTSITATTNARIEGRLLARNGAVTLDTNTFTEPSCVQAPVTTTTVRGATTTTVRGATTTTVRGATTTLPSSPTTTPTTPTTVPGGSTLPATGSSYLYPLAALLMIGFGFSVRVLSVRRVR
jgi:hypothetical protein